MAVLIGNASDNFLEGDFNDDYIAGLEGNDDLWGNDGNDSIYGGSGHDYVAGGHGADVLDGGTGNDTLSPGDDLHRDTILGGAGFDVVDYGDVEDGVVVDLTTNIGGGRASGDTYDSIEDVFGSLGDDEIYGSAGRNIFYDYFDSNDYYDGRSGFDQFNGSLYHQFHQTVTIEIAYGVRAEDLAGIAGVTVNSGEGIAFWRIWEDANFDSIEQPHEVRIAADILVSIEDYAGGFADDTIRGSGQGEFLSGREGSNYLDGGGGFDYAGYQFSSAGVGVDLRTGDAAHGDPDDEYNDVLVRIEGVAGSYFGDQIIGNSVANVMFGFDGDDALVGLGGRDMLYGGNGNDILIGGGGNDVLGGGNGRDVLDGGTGLDTASYRYSESPVHIDLRTGEGGTPTYGDPSDSEAEGDNLISIENVIGSANDDIIIGSNHDNVIEGADGDDLLVGCDGDDVIYGERSPTSPEPDGLGYIDPRWDPVELEDCGCEDKEDGSLGTPVSYDDDIRGGRGNDSLFGGLGSDLIRSGKDDDYIEGNEGIDLLHGGSGNDVLAGGPGVDFIIGGQGFDTADYSTSDEGVTVNLGAWWLNSGGDAAADLISVVVDLIGERGDLGNIWLDTAFVSLIAESEQMEADGNRLSLPDIVLGVEDLVGSLFDDHLTGDGSGNIVSGGFGNDTILGLGGDDVLDGWFGADQLLGGDGDDELIGGNGGDSLFGDDGSDLLLGGNGDDTLNGGAGDDQLVGGAGGDLLIGGSGRNTLIGGNQADTFVFQEAADSLPGARTRISDFSSSQGDVIDLSGIDADTTTAGNQAFSFIGSDPFSGAPGELTFFSAGTHGEVRGDIDGNGLADFNLLLLNVTAITESDFLL